MAGTQSGSDENLTGLVPSWVQEFGTNGYDSSEAIAMDGEGNVYVTGVTQGDLGGINNGEGDIWLSKYDSNGKQLWIEQWGTAFADAPEDLSVDSNGNIYIAARTLALQDEGFYANEYALIKYDASGNLLSVDSQPQTNTINEIEVDGAGNLYTLGFAENENKWFVSKNNSNGDRLWFQEFNSSVHGAFEGLSNLTVNNQGDVYFGTSITLDAIFTQTMHRIVKYSSAGRKQWSKDFWDGFLPDISSDSNGNLYAFGNGELVKYNSNGNLQWEYQWEDKDGWQFSEEVRVDRDGNVYLLVNLGGPEAEFIQLDTTGKELWKEPLNLTKSIAEIEVNGDGTIYLTGRIKGDFSNLDFDAWVGKFDAIAPVNEPPTDITLNNNTIAENSATGTVIGELTTTDTDSEIHTYTLVNDAEGRFVIEGNELKVASDLDFEITNSHTVKIRTTDSGEPVQSLEKEFAIEVTDVEDNTVTSTTNYRLEATKENLNLIGEDAINGIGNNLDNRISGNNAKNRIWGKDGNDVLIGGGDNDVLIGNEGSDRLIGNRGNDFLNGGPGIDTMNGGPGNDTYIVNHTKDVVKEGTNRGTDVVKSSASYNLGANIENLNLIGEDAINGIGNNLDNRISGNNAKNRIWGKDGNDVLIGGGGNDTLIGGGGSDRLIGNQGNDFLNGGPGIDTMNGGPGNDTYIVNHTKDVVKEGTNRGTDVVKSSASYNLGANIENLNLIGKDAINGIGNNLDNRISGNNAKNRIIGKAGDDVLIGRGGNDTLIGGGGSDRLIGNQGNDILDGGVGNDTLIGGGGSDRFVFSTGKSYRQASPGRDVIRDFRNRDNDKIILDKTTFGALDSQAGRGFSIIAEFDVVNRDAAVASSDAVIVYNENNGKLFYNANGSNSGLGVGGVFAVLDNSPQLQANDFIIRT